ncbi:hypothetical protein E1A91_A09G020500v1 [Gossypium mustelinum]|uniref:Uncharacterized protein n=2 Tax=Gossypium TaxID=3633 RepID=A0A5D2XTA8_GOSMU|nr:hypothetical protein ES288_A09G022500v1 [Gossypium darwinii]TYJ17002.1 hypothetical protein E1A91_A09G020500v1 [Gossypium mustelinum]
MLSFCISVRVVCVSLLQSIRTGARRRARVKEAVLGTVPGEPNPSWLLVTSRSFRPGLYEPTSRISGHECRLLLRHRSATRVWVRVSLRLGLWGYWVKDFGHNYWAAIDLV